jgi:hypothetical protein
MFLADWSDDSDYHLFLCPLKAYIREFSIFDPVIGRDIVSDE